jgi:hypothetical protein
MLLTQPKSMIRCDEVWVINVSIELTLYLAKSKTLTATKQCINKR